jgi:hypothetical protein
MSWVLLCLTAVLWVEINSTGSTAIAQSSPHSAHPQQTRESLVPGMSVMRPFGPAQLWISVDHHLAEMELEVLLSGQPIFKQMLTPEASTVRLDLVNGTAALRGSLMVHFGYPGTQSFVDGDFVVLNGAVSTPFRGEIVSWQSPEHLLQKQQERWITPEIRVVTGVLLQEQQAAEVQLYAGTQIMGTLALSQGANDVEVATAFNVGTVHIDPGLKVHLQPATPQQDGAVSLDGTFASSNLPHVVYSGAIATWSYQGP